MKKIAIKYTLEIPSKDWDVLVRYFKKTGQIRTESDLRNKVKKVAQSYGYQGINDCCNDGLDWLEENDPSWKITKKLFDDAIADAKNHINPSKNVKKNRDEFIKYWEEGEKISK